jgi:hypothetical protein
MSCKVLSDTRSVPVPEGLMQIKSPTKEHRVNRVATWVLLVIGIGA